MALKHQEEYEREFRGILDSRKWKTMRGAGSLGAADVWASPRPRVVAHFEVRASGDGGDFRITRKERHGKQQDVLVQLELQGALAFYALRQKGYRTRVTDRLDFREDTAPWRILAPSSIDGSFLRWGHGIYIEEMEQRVGGVGWS
jgi:hypothetical protein